MTLLIVLPTACFFKKPTMRATSAIYVISATFVRVRIGRVLTSGMALNLAQNF